MILKTPKLVSRCHIWPPARGELWMGNISRTASPDYSFRAKYHSTRDAGLYEKKKSTKTRSHTLTKTPSQVQTRRDVHNARTFVQKKIIYDPAPKAKHNELYVASDDRLLNMLRGWEWEYREASVCVFVLTIYVRACKMLPKTRPARRSSSSLCLRSY